MKLTAMTFFLFHSADGWVTWFCVGCGLAWASGTSAWRRLSTPVLTPQEFEDDSIELVGAFELW